MTSFSTIGGDIHYVVLHSTFEERLLNKGRLDELRKRFEYNDFKYSFGYETVAIVDDQPHTFRTLTETEEKIIGTLKENRMSTFALFKVFSEEEDDGTSYLQGLISFIKLVAKLEYAACMDIQYLKQFSTDNKTILVAEFDAESG